MNNFGKTNQISIGSNLFLLFDKFQQIFKLNEIEKNSSRKKISMSKKIFQVKNINQLNLW